VDDKATGNVPGELVSECTFSLTVRALISDGWWGLSELVGQRVRQSEMVVDDDQTNANVTIRRACA
jgi:hypothetical protein